MTTGMAESIEAATQVDDPVAKVEGAVRGSEKKPGQVAFTGHNEHEGGVP